MGRVVVHSAAIAALARSPEVQRLLGKIGKDVLDEAQENILTMGAYDTGAMLESGFIDQEDGAVVAVGFDVVYAPIVHEGTGLGRNSNPRPFLAKAAARYRGVYR